jgi:DNA-binding XRE family transcriptional regulator
MTNTTAFTRAALLRRLPPPDQRQRIRQACSLSLNDLAQTLGVTPQAVHAWENGTTPNAHHLGPYVELLDHLRLLSGTGDQP